MALLPNALGRLADRLRSMIAPVAAVLNPPPILDTPADLLARGSWNDLDVWNDDLPWKES